MIVNLLFETSGYGHGHKQFLWNARRGDEIRGYVETPYLLEILLEESIISLGSISSFQSTVICGKAQNTHLTNSF